MIKLTRDNFEDYRRKCKEERNKPIKVAVANGTCAQIAGSKDIVKEFKKQLADHKLNDIVLLTETSCLGLCVAEPNVLIQLNQKECPIFYANLKPEDVKSIVTETIIKKKVIKNLLFKDLVTGRRPLHREQMPFYYNQKKVLLKHY
ncbi:hypothetical protein ES703_123304 [subsurface metagenome]